MLSTVGGPVGPAGPAGPAGPPGAAGGRNILFQMLGQGVALTGYVWAAMPAALTAGFGFLRGIEVDLTGFSQVRLQAYMLVTGFAGAQLRGQYWDGAAWQYLDGAAGPQLAIDGTAYNVNMDVGPWVNLVAGAKAIVPVRIVGIGGNGVVNPSFGRVVIEARS